MQAHKASLALFCLRFSEKSNKKLPYVSVRQFVVHHVGANPNTFVYPGCIGITRLLTRK